MTEIESYRAMSVDPTYPKDLQDAALAIYTCLHKQEQTRFAELMLELPPVHIQERPL
jgi:hypothetical protein